MPVTNERFDLAAAVPAWDELGAVHLVAIGGAGMSAVARLLLQRGVAVSGSDAADSPVLEALRAAGATVWVGHDPAHLDGVDTVVVSSAIRDDNPELAAARQRGLRVLHRSQALAAVSAGTRVVAVAGANGKTTTTSMLTAALVHAGADPSFASGGEIAQLGTNAALGAGEAFVVEADESDGSFVVYRPEVAVVTSVQPDHLDFYGTAEAVTEAYDVFAGTVRPAGCSSRATTTPARSPSRSATGPAATASSPTASTPTPTSGCSPWRPTGWAPPPASGTAGARSSSRCGSPVCTTSSTPWGRSAPPSTASAPTSTRWSRGSGASPAPAGGSRCAARSTA